MEPWTAPSSASSSSRRHASQPRIDSHFCYQQLSSQASQLWDYSGTNQSPRTSFSENDYVHDNVPEAGPFFEPMDLPGVTTAARHSDPGINNSIARNDADRLAILQSFAEAESSRTISGPWFSVNPIFPPRDSGEGSNRRRTERGSNAAVHRSLSALALGSANADFDVDSDDETCVGQADEGDGMQWRAATDGGGSRARSQANIGAGADPQTRTAASYRPTVPGHDARAETRAQARGNAHHATSASREALILVANETVAKLPFVLRKLPNFNAHYSQIVTHHSHGRLPLVPTPPSPFIPPVTIHVLNMDAFNVAELNRTLPDRTSPAHLLFDDPTGSTGKRVVVLNLASYTSPGGGFMRGALAQEEALCYRSSLSMSLHRDYYPLRQRMCIYSPDVVVFRSDHSSGHRLLHAASDVVPQLDVPPSHLVSVLSVAALRDPPVVSRNGRLRFARREDRLLTATKMRLALRAMLRHGHRTLVLGALGCGAFNNPPEEVANLWLSVLREDEFHDWLLGGHVLFAVLDSEPARADSNFAIFRRVLDRQVL